MKKPNNYQHYELDLDGNYYRFEDKDVQDFVQSVYPSLYKYFESIRNKLKQYLYIKWNRIFFTYKGVKYSFQLSHTEEEYNYYHIIRHNLLNVYDCTDVVFDYGVLD